MLVDAYCKDGLMGKANVLRCLMLEGFSQHSGITAGLLVCVDRETLKWP